MAINHENYDPGLKYGALNVTNDLADGLVTGVKMHTRINYISVVKELPPGLADVETSLFGTSGLGVAATVTGIVCNSLDSTAINVALSAGTASIGTVILGGLSLGSASAGAEEALESVAVTAGVNIFVAPKAGAAVRVTVFLETD